MSLHELTNDQRLLLDQFASSTLTQEHPDINPDNWEWDDLPSWWTSTIEDEYDIHTHDFCKTAYLFCKHVLGVDSANLSKPVCYLHPPVAGEPRERHHVVLVATDHGILVLDSKAPDVLSLQDTEYDYDLNTIKPSHREAAANALSYRTSSPRD